MDISVLIVSHGHENYLPRLLQSLKQQNNCSRVEILLLHNLASKFQCDSSVRQFHNTNPKGLAENLNRLIYEALAPVILIINPDTYLPEKCLQTCLNALRKNHILSCQSIHPNGKRLINLRKFPSIIGLINERFCDSERRMRDQIRLEQTVLSDCWFQGSFIMAHREIFRNLLFDERYELYFEDVDFFRRACAQKLSLQYLTDTHYFHYHQQASNDLSSSQFWMHCRSALRYFTGF